MPSDAAEELQQGRIAPCAHYFLKIKKLTIVKIKHSPYELIENDSSD